MNDKSGVAVVIGAGGGLGAGLARRFAAAGMAVAIASRNPHNAEELASGVESVTGGNAYGYACDVRDEIAVNDLFNRPINRVVDLISVLVDLCSDVTVSVHCAAPLFIKLTTTC